MPLQYHENFLRALEKNLSLQELYYTNFIYGSYNKKRVFSLHYKGFGSDDIILVGDSHLISLEHVFRVNRHAFKNLYINRYHGATSFGLRPSKKFGQFSHFVSEMSLLKGKEVLVFFCIGEVECRNTIGMFADNSNSDDRTILDLCTENYSKIVKELVSLFNGRLYLINIPLPTYTDQEIWTKNSRPVEEIKKLTSFINKKIDSLAESQDKISVFDLASHCKSGDSVFYGDHHIDAYPFENLLKKEGLI